MSSDELKNTVERLRAAEFRRVVRGFDPEQVKSLLRDAADSLATAGREQNELRRELERLRAANDEEAISKALVNATRAGEALLADAREAAAATTAEAEAQATALLERATETAESRQQAASAAREELDRELAAARAAVEQELESARARTGAELTGARREISQLEEQATRLRSLVRDMERRIVEIAEGALEELEASAASSSASNRDLLADLEPTVEPSDVAAD